jgi:hypothetical protein
LHVVLQDLDADYHPNPVYTSDKQKRLINNITGGYRFPEHSLEMMLRDASASEDYEYSGGTTVFAGISVTAESGHKVPAR